MSAHRPGLEVRDASIVLPEGAALFAPLSFRVRPGEVFVVRGPSGVGKSSLLHLIAGTLDETLSAQGHILIDGERIDGLAPSQRGVGLVLQRDYLFPHMTVIENLLFAVPRGPRSQREARALQALDSAGLSGMASRRPGTLSGGQRARVSLLRSLLAGPRVLLLDEAFASLDPELRSDVREYCFLQCAELPVVMVTHDLNDVPVGAAECVLSAAE